MEGTKKNTQNSMKSPDGPGEVTIEEFESIDKPLSGGEKLRFGILVTFMYGIFAVAVGLTAYYNS